jgi:hypothetical protein
VRSSGSNKASLCTPSPEIGTGMQSFILLRCSEKHFVIVFLQLEQQDPQMPVRPQQQRKPSQKLMDPVNIAEKTLQFTPTPVRCQLDLSHKGIHTLSYMPRPPPGLDQHVTFRDMGRMTTIISDSGLRAVSSEEEFSLSGIEDSDDEDDAPVPTAIPPAHVAGPVGSKRNRKANNARTFFKLDGNNPRRYICEFCECIIPIIMSIRC